MSFVIWAWAGCGPDPMRNPILNPGVSFRGSLSGRRLICMLYWNTRRVLWLRRDGRPTFQTLVSDLKVWLEVVMARSDVVKVVVENSDATRPASWAVSVQHVHHVHGTVDVTEVLSHAPADAHPAIARMRNDQHLADTASHPEVLRLTIRMLERRRRPQFPV